MLIYTTSGTAVKKLAAGKTIYGKILVHTFGQGLANYSPQTKCGLQPIFVWPTS